MTEQEKPKDRVEIPAKAPSGSGDEAAAEAPQSFWARTRAELKLQDVLHLISVVGVGVAAIVAGTLNWYSLSPHAVLRTSVLACRADGIDVALSNIGNRTAFIEGGTAQVFVAKQHQSDLDRTMIPDTNLILKSRESATLTFKLKERLSPLANDEQASQCSLKVVFHWTEAGSDFQPVNGECPCPPLAS